MAEKLQLRYCTKMYQERHYSIQSSTWVCVVLKVTCTVLWQSCISHCLVAAAGVVWPYGFTLSGSSTCKVLRPTAFYVITSQKSYCIDLPNYYLPCFLLFSLFVIFEPCNDLWCCAFLTIPMIKVWRIIIMQV